MGNCDYLIIGSGAAGSVLANRLSASGRKQVLLVEAGADLPPGREPADIRNIFPMSSFNHRYMWPDTHVHWRRRDNSPRVPLQQGRILGGSTALMGMWALRGHPHDYDEWEAAGADGWGWAGVLPYFRRLETDHDFGGPLHGKDGPLPIRRETAEQRVPLARGLHAATIRRGWADIADMNGDFRDGHCTLPVSREERGRGSAGMHYLTREVRARPNLRVLTDHEVERLLVEGGRVCGALAVARDGERKRLRARTVVVAAGALRSPVLLMRSGIGPAEQLRAAGVEVVRDLPGVGRNLQNHAVLYLVGMLTRAGRDPPGARPAGSTCLRWTSGLPDTPPADMSMYVRSYLAWHALGRRMASLAPVLMRPASIGRVTLDPADASPVIEFDLLSDPRDLRRMTDALRLTAELFDELTAAGLTGDAMVLTQAAGLMRYNKLTRFNAVRAGAAALMLSATPPLGRALLRRLAKMTPARDIVDDDDALADFARRAVTGAGHVCGTCRIGRAGDAMAVVDATGRVHGVEGLMVADASVMPAVPGGNTHLPVIMAAEKIAAALTGDVACAEPALADV